MWKVLRIYTRTIRMIQRPLSILENRRASKSLSRAASRAEETSGKSTVTQGAKAALPIQEAIPKRAMETPM